MRLLPLRGSQAKNPTDSCALSPQWGLCSSDRLSKASLLWGSLCHCLGSWGHSSWTPSPSLPFHTGAKSQCRLHSGTTTSGQCNPLQVLLFKVTGLHFHFKGTIKSHLWSTHIHQECWTDDNTNPAEWSLLTSSAASHNRKKGSHLWNAAPFKVGQKLNPMGLGDVTRLITNSRAGSRAGLSYG